jgi:predicted dehydrogenase
MTVKWGLIGCGDIARKRIAPALHDLSNCELVAVSRANFAKAEAFAKEFGAKKWYENWQDLIKDDEIDAVYIATPVYLHAEQTIAAAQAGKHILCEKPMAMNTNECDRMIAACKANSVKLCVAYYRHFYPVVLRVKEILSSGEIGQPVVAQINAFELFNPQPDNPRYWLIKKELSGGGPMFDFGCHRIEVFINIFGAILQTKSVLRNILFEREVEDTCVAFFQFNSGASGVLTVTHAAHEPQDTLSIFGSRGSIHISSLNEGDMIVKTIEGERIESHAPIPNFHQPLIDDFAQAVAEDREPKVNGETGREVARIEEEIYRITPELLKA